jgi:sensor histidine kinase YesM
MIVSVNHLDAHQMGIATQYGAYLLHTGDYQLTPLTFEAEENLKNWAFYITDIGRDTLGNYGLSTKTGFYIFNSSGKFTTSRPYYTTADIGKSWMLYGRKIYTLPDGRMIQKNSEGYCVFDPSSNRIYTNANVAQVDTALLSLDPEIDLKRIPDEGLAYLSVRYKKIILQHLPTQRSITLEIEPDLAANMSWRSDIHILNDSTLLITGNKGCYTLHYSFENNRAQIASRLLLPEITITSVLTDSDKRIWLGTNDGLYKQESLPTIKGHKVSGDYTGLPLIIKYMEKGDGVWYVSTIHSGLLVLDDQTYAIKDQVFCKKDNTILSTGKIFPFSDELLWICTFRGLFSYHKKTGEIKPLIFDNCPECTANMFVQDIYRSRSGDIWVTGNEENKAYKIDPTGKQITLISHDTINEKFRVNIPFRISEDPEGHIWFCGDAMARYNVTRQRIDSLIEKLPLQRNAKKPYFLHFNSLNDRWFTTNNDNWHILRPGQAFEIFGDERLSPAITHYQTMIGDVLHYLSVQGTLVTLDTRTRQYRILAAADGWMSERITSLGFFKNHRTNEILFAGDDVIYTLTGGQPLQHRQNAPLISNINIFGKRTIDLPGDQIVFAPDENTMLLKFITLNFDDPGNQVFSYTLENNSAASWIRIDKPEILLTQIPPGRYTLTLKVESKNNYWPPTYRAYQITVQAPLYARWVFILPLMLILGLISWLIIRYRMSEMRTISNLDRMVVEYELKALHAQMNPHFVFNCLNSIKEMIMSKDNTNANIYLNKFSYLLRSTLDQSQLPAVPLSMTMEYIRNYLEMEKLRFDQFQYTIETDSTLQADIIQMAPLLLQPIVENALWHGLGGQKGNKQLFIRYFRKGDDVVCEVEDFGAGIHAKSKDNPSKEHHSVALDNIRKRIELLNTKYAADYKLDIIDKSEQALGSGTIVRLQFKHNTYEPD